MALRVRQSETAVASNILPKALAVPVDPPVVSTGRGAIVHAPLRLTLRYVLSRVFGRKQSPAADSRRDAGGCVLLPPANSRGGFEGFI